MREEKGKEGPLLPVICLHLSPNLTGTGPCVLAVLVTVLNYIVVVFVLVCQPY
jgi:hypothetical protein